MSDELNPHQIATLFQERTGRQPKNAELFLNEGMLWVWRAQRRVWEHLGTQEDPAGFQGTGMMEYELQDGILVRGSPAFVFSLVFRAFYGIDEDKAKDLVQFLYEAFKECGWRGPAETDVDARPGSVHFLGAVTTKRTVADLRPIYSQLQDPELNGWVAVESDEGTSFHNVQKLDEIQIIEDK
jgi:hypothetical protein